MLQLKPACEHCACALPNDSDAAMICSYECTFCRDCVDEVLHNVCPNCGGGFQPRPTRPQAQLAKHPMRADAPHKPVDPERFAPLLAAHRDTPPRRR